MYTFHEFVYFERLYEYPARRNELGFAIDRSFRRIHVRTRQGLKMSFHINKDIVLPEIKSRKKIKLYFDFFRRGNNKDVSLKIVDVKLYECS